MLDKTLAVRLCRKGALAVSAPAAMQPWVPQNLTWLLANSLSAGPVMLLQRINEPQRRCSVNMSPVQTPVGPQGWSMDYSDWLVELCRDVERTVWLFDSGASIMFQTLTYGSQARQPGARCQIREHSAFCEPDQCGASPPCAYQSSSPVSD